MKMNPRDDETLPLSGLSEDFSADVTVDEDFIPTSQPRSNPSPKTGKKGDISSIVSLEETNTQSLSGFVNDTLPPEALSQETQDKSVDFIPDTDTKKRRIYPFDTVACKKKLPLFGSEKIFVSFWEKHKLFENSILKLQASPAACDSSVKMESSSVKASEGSTPEAVINDSADTVQLGDSPAKVVEFKSLEKLETPESLSPDKCEETQIFDNSLLMLDQPGPSCSKEVSSQKLYANETVDDELQLEVKDNLEISRGQDEKENEETLAKEKISEDITSQEADQDSPHLILKKFELKLNVSCLLTVNTLSKKVTKKTILNVEERFKLKTPATYSELLIDSVSEKSKRFSTSSSGSVYSDKNNLPFALPKKASSDQASDSSEDSWEIRRLPWCNECLLSFKMDEIIRGMMENQDLTSRPDTESPKESRRRTRQIGANLMDNILERDLPLRPFKPETDVLPEKILEGDSSDTVKCSTPTSILEDLPPEEPAAALDEAFRKYSTDPVESSEPETVQEKQIDPQPGKPQDVSLCDGLRVFARWTDKQYYSGVLSGQPKNDKWDVMFDDGTLKAIKEDFIMPAAWLKVGSLVFALVDDSYESGQVSEIKTGDAITYVIQLDSEEREVMIGLSDMSLSDDMASLLKEDYRPAESPQKRADINCDNVLSGKRLRDTPLRPLMATRIESIGSRKKPTSKTKDPQAIKETPRKRKSVKKGGEKSESGNSADKSSDSVPSGAEAGETPVRNTGKEARGKAKPRSLTYEPEERLKRKQRDTSTSEDAAIPGPSGVKFKKRTAHESATNISLESSSEKSVSGTPWKGRRKRRAVESGKEESPKRSDAEIRMTRSKKK